MAEQRTNAAQERAGWIAAAGTGIAAALMFAPSIPPAPFPHADTLFHVVVFGGLACAIAAALGARFGWAAAAIIVLAAAGVEGAQALTPHRALEAKDLFANLGGAVLGCGFWMALTARRQAAMEPISADA